MSVARIAARYSKSLLDLAVEQNKLDRILEDVQALKKATEQRDLNLLLKSPIVNPSKKATILKEIFGGKVDELSMAFINIIVNKGRESLLPEIAEEFIQQYRSLKNISTIKLTTATQWTDAQIEGIRTKVIGALSNMEDVEIVSSVNPDLIGGFVIELGDKLYDASVAHKLDKLRKEFSKN